MRLLLYVMLIIPAFAQDEIKDYYAHNTGPRVNLTTDPGAESSVYNQLDIRAILGIVKFELAKGTWPELSRGERDGLLSIIDDPNLKFVYTGKQSTLAHSSGGQTIDKNTVKIHQDGFYVNGAPRSPDQLGKILLHEMGH